MRLPKVPGLLVEITTSDETSYQEYDTKVSSARAASCSIVPKLGESYCVKITLSKGFHFHEQCVRCRVHVDGRCIGITTVFQASEVHMKHEYDIIGGALYGRELIFAASSAGANPTVILSEAEQENMDRLGSIEVEIRHLKYKKKKIAKQAINHSEVQKAVEDEALGKLQDCSTHGEPVVFDETQFKKGASQLHCTTGRGPPVVLKTAQDRTANGSRFEAYGRGRRKPLIFTFKYGFSSQETTEIALDETFFGSSTAKSGDGEEPDLEIVDVRERERPIIDIADCDKDMIDIDREAGVVDGLDLPVGTSTANDWQGGSMAAQPSLIDLKPPQMRTSGGQATVTLDPDSPVAVEEEAVETDMDVEFLDFGHEVELLF